MKIKTEVLPADKAESIVKAAELLRSGELVALPTETVYGIAADARNGEAVKKIFVAKGRPQDNPLIVHVTGPEMLPGLVSEVPERAQLLMAAFCPGPLTIIMPRGPEVAAESGHGGYPHAQPPGGPCGHRAERLRLCSPQCQPLRQAQPHQCAGCLYRYGRSPAPHSGRRRV